MLRISQVKCQVGHTQEQLQEKIRKKLRLRDHEDFSFEIVRQSIDARHKDQIQYVYTVDVIISGEERRKLPADVARIKRVTYTVPRCGTSKLAHRPVIVGSGPAGLFCALLLARAGYRPVILERGARVEERRKEVDRFWESGRLNPDSNVQFGEGGAGAFSDGKLNTQIKDKSGRIRYVLESFVRAGDQYGSFLHAHEGAGKNNLVFQRIRRKSQDYHTG